MQSPRPSHPPSPLRPSPHPLLAHPPVYSPATMRSSSHPSEFPFRWLAGSSPPIGGWGSGPHTSPTPPPQVMFQFARFVCTCDCFLCYQAGGFMSFSYAAACRGTIGCHTPLFVREGKRRGMSKGHREGNYLILRPPPQEVGLPPWTRRGGPVASWRSLFSLPELAAPNYPGGCQIYLLLLFIACRGTIRGPPLSCE